MKNPLMLDTVICRHIFAALVLQALPMALHADVEISPPVLEFATGLPGKQVRLSWQAQDGLRYHVEKSTDLSPGSWKRVAQITSSGPDAVWKDPEPVTTRCFYRVTEPRIEVFSISSALLQPFGGEILIHGQRIPAGSFLVLETGGGSPPVFVPLVALGGGFWQASVSGVNLPAGAVISATIEDGNGVILVTIGQTISVTSTGLADDGPPSMPPAMAARYNFQLGRMAVEDYIDGRAAGPGRDNDCDDTDDTSLIVAWLSKKGYDYYQAQSALNGAAATSGSYALCYSVNNTEWTRSSSGRSSNGNPLYENGNTGTNNPLYEAQRFFSKKGYDYWQAQSQMSPASKKGYDYWQVQSALSSTGLHNNPVFQENSNAEGQMPERTMPSPSGIPGEVSFQTCDLALPCAAGPALAWVRTYRSMKPVSSGHGPGWDFSYNIFIEPVTAPDGVTISSVIVHDGGGRADTFHLQGDGTYACDGMFRTGSFSGNTFTLKFADKATWTFNTLGKIASISDRNGVSLTCVYDASGNISSVNDAFGRSITVEWDTGSPQRIASVSARNGGAIYLRTAYVHAGTDRLLSSASAPFIPGTPSTVGDTVYAYASGSTDPRLNDNLASITDGAGRLLEAFGYATQTDPLHLAYDTCVSRDRHKTGHVTLIKREAAPPSSTPPCAYTISEVDEIGRLTQTDCDAHHRTLAVREYTGYCPLGGTPPSFTPNPTTKNHDNDPDYFETTFKYNADGMCTRVTHPDGSQERAVYDRDFRDDCPVRERGNARLLTLRTPAGEERVVALDHLPGFGSPEAMRPGNPIGGLNIKGGQNPKPKGTALVWSPRSNYLDDDDDGDGVPTADELIVPVAMDKGLRRSAGSDSSILRKEEGGRHTPFHKKYRPQYLERERGITINTSHVEYETAMLGGGVDDDCDGFVTRMVSAYGQVSSWGYDANGNLTSYVSALPNRGKLFQYNSRGQCTSATTLNGASSSFHAAFNYGANGFLDSIVRDSGGLNLTTTLGRDAQGRVTSVIDPRGNDWIFAYNPLDQCVQIQSPQMPNRISMNVTIDAGGRVARCDVEHRSPDGSLVGGNEVPPVISTQFYSTFYVYDTRAKLVRIAQEERPVDGSPTVDPATLGIENFAVCDITYDDAGQIVKLSTPAACRAQSVDRDCDFQYDERGLLHRCIDGGLVTTEYDYDAYGALTRCATINSGGPSPQTLFEYDGFHRLFSTTDPMGNVAVHEYGNNGSVTTSIYGEVNDAPGSAGNVLLSRRLVLLSGSFGSGSGVVVDSLLMPALMKAKEKANKTKCSNQLRTMAPFFNVEVADDTITEERFSPGDTGVHATEVTVVDRSPAGLVQSVTRNGDVLLNCAYDSAGRLQSCSNGACTTTLTRDNNGNVLVCGQTEHFSVGGLPPKTFSVACTYDALGRVTHTTDGIGNSASFAYDSLGRCVSLTEPGGRVLRAQYDGDSPTSGAFSRRVLADLDADGLDDLVYATLARSGECRSVTDTNGSSTTHTRDKLGRVVHVGHPDGTSEAYAFDALGRLSTRTCQDGSVCTTGHDLNGRVTTCSWSTAPGDTVTTTVADTTYQHDGLGRCTGSSQGGSVLVFAYDSLGNQTAETSNGSTVTRGFDHRGRTRITYPDGRMFAESRDAFGRLLAVAKVMGGNPVSPPIVSMQYLGMRVSKSTQANGVVTDYTYRANGDVAPPGEPDASFAACVRVTVRDAFSNVLTDKIVRRDANQRVTSEETAFSSVADAPGRTKSFTRDAAGRVTACDITRRETAGGPLIPESSVSYVLAKDGKRVSEVRNSVAGSYTQGSGDLEMGQYTTWPGGTGSIEWDDNGNLGIMPTATSQIAFAKNVQGRVVSVSDVTDPLNPVTLVSYDYDALGRCVSRSVDSPGGLSSEVTGFVFDGSVCIQELGDDGNGTINAAVTLVCGDGVRHCISTRNGTLFYPHGASTAVARESTGVFAMACTGGPDTVTNSTGAVTERFDHDDACKPIFLESNGQPASRTSAVGPLRWMAPETMWEPDINMHVGSGGDFYSPDLGMIVAKAKDTTSGVGKKEFKGHVTLLK